MKNVTTLLHLSLLVPFAWMTVVTDTCRGQDTSGMSTPPEGFVALFNGKDLDGWYGHGTQDPQTLWDMTPEAFAAHQSKTREDVREHWRVENGELINDGHGLYATTNRDYGDFELLIEYKTVAKADSGIYLRGVPQVQIWDSTEAGGKWNIGANFGSGGLWNNGADAPGKNPTKLMDKPFGQWNHFRIIMVGARVTVWLNGERIVDHAVMENFFKRRGPKGPIYPRGPIQLQTHGGEIRWRNIFIREIDPEGANYILRRGGPDRRVGGKGFRPLFNGADWDGWRGPLDKNLIQDGMILSRNGTIFTEQTFDDFTVRFDFKLPAGGNNGLAIRYPGQGDTAYVGMCELQILDDPAPGYAKLKAQQYHGSIYGMVAAHRGYLRPTGQWNHQVVTVQGARITVELNGTIITDADLSTVDPESFMYDANRFKGRSRTSGHFGFAGHGKPVVYRNVEIMELTR